VVSAHWQEDGYRVTSHDCPGLEYDYFGFPKHLHSLEYRPPGDPKFAKKVGYCTVMMNTQGKFLRLAACGVRKDMTLCFVQLSKLLHKEGFPTKLTRRKGLDSGTFVPLLALFPTGHIPVIQLSLRDTHDFAEHVAVGKVLSQFRQYGTLIIGPSSLEVG
jgi:aromatic ring-opening dioxygenase catalytic subunit (LigB family)